MRKEFSFRRNKSKTNGGNVQNNETNEMKRNKSLWRVSLFAEFIVSSVSFIFLAEVARPRFGYINTLYTYHVPRNARIVDLDYVLEMPFSLYAPPICTTTRRTASIQAIQIAGTRLHFSRTLRTTPFTVSRIPLGVLFRFSFSYGFVHSFYLGDNRCRFFSSAFWAFSDNEPIYRLSS